MIKSTEIMEHLEDEINKMCNAGDGWENWYPKYFRCDYVNFVQDVFSWLEYADGEVVECHDMCSWEKTALEYNNDTEKALKDVHRIVKRIYDECFFMDQDFRSEVESMDDEELHYYLHGGDEEFDEDDFDREDAEEQAIDLMRSEPK